MTGCVLALLVLASAPAPADPPPRAASSIILATTTSTRDTGLLDALVPRFTEKTGIGVKVIAVGSGAALDMAKRGEADALLAHAPEAEAALVESGELVAGVRVMHNDFVIVGPKKDPAKVASSADLFTALSSIRENGLFLSRGDDSGTHKKELAIFERAGIPVDSGRWRLESGQGMAATLFIASEKDAYCLTDRGTWLAQQKRLSRLRIVFEGDPALRNEYRAYAVSAVRHPKAREREAREWVRFLTDPETQAFIGEFRRADLGAGVFVPDALPAAVPEDVVPK